MKIPITFCLALVLQIPFILSQETGNDSLATKRPARIQLALLLDTSKSMDGLIHQAQSQLWKMVNELSGSTKKGQKPKVEIALFEYGRSRIEASNGFVRQVTPLTTDLDWVSEQLFGLKTSGSVEFCGWAIEKAATGLDWSVDTSDLRMIIIAGNEPFYQGDVDFRGACQLAKTKGIMVNTIFCGSYREGIRELWKEGADIGRGKYMSINQEEKIYHIETPYDEAIIALNAELNQTYLPFGPLGAIYLERLKIQDENALSFGNASMRARVKFKISESYSNVSWDLVDACDANKNLLGDIATIDLPGVIKSKTLEERRLFIEEKQKERNRIRQAINDQMELARSYINNKKKQKKEGEKTLDLVMLETIRLQAEKHGFQFEN